MSRTITLILSVLLNVRTLLALRSAEKQAPGQPAWVPIPLAMQPGEAAAASSDLLRKTNTDVASARIICPVIAVLYKKGAIKRKTTFHELYDGFTKVLKMENTSSTRWGFGVVWQVAALDYEVDVFRLPHLHLVTSRVRNPGVNASLFFQIRAHFAGMKKVCMRDSREVTEFFYHDKPYVLPSRIAMMITAPLILLWNWFIDNPLTYGLRGRITIDGLFFLWPLMVQAFGQEDVYFVPDPRNPSPLADGTQLMVEKKTKCLFWEDLEKLFLDAELPSYDWEPWGRTAFLNAAMSSRD